MRTVSRYDISTGGAVDLIDRIENAGALVERISAEAEALLRGAFHLMA